MTDATAPATLAQADARRTLARQQLMNRLNQVQDKLSPRTLAQDAVESTMATVRAKPQAAAITAGVAMLFFLRKPLARLIRRGVSHETGTATMSLKDEGAPRDTKGYET